LTFPLRTIEEIELIWTICLRLVGRS